jgi:hypothetical protein
METELWPNLAAACRAAGVPLFLVNARLSPKSAAGYARIGALARPLLRSLAGVAAQSAADAARLAALGAQDVAVTGNLKFDVAAPPASLAAGQALRAEIGRRTAGVDRGIDARRRGGAGAGRARRRGGRAAAGDADDHRAAPSPALRRGRAAPRGSQRPVRSRGRARARPSPPPRASCSATRWASCLPIAPPPMSRSSAAVSFPSVVRT